MTKIDFDPFIDSEGFFRWVETNYGSDVREACKSEIALEAGKDRPAKPIAIVVRLTRNTRRIDRSRVGLRARFTY